MKNNVVILELDRPRQVKFTYSALQTLSAMTGKAMHELDDAFDTADFKSIEVIAYCGLLYDAAKNKETLTPESIAALLDEAPSFRLVIEKLIEAWTIAFGALDIMVATPEGNQKPKAEK